MKQKINVELIMIKSIKNLINIKNDEDENEYKKN